MHWYALVLYKWFLTPFRDGIWNCRLVSVGDRGSFPHDPETVGDMPTWHTRLAKRGRVRPASAQIRKYVQ